MVITKTITVKITTGLGSYVGKGGLYEKIDALINEGAEYIAINKRFVEKMEIEITGNKK